MLGPQPAGVVRGGFGGPRGRGVKALIGISVLLLALLAIACGDPQKPAPSSLDEPLLTASSTAMTSGS
jgi:hypothetical protein